MKNRHPVQIVALLAGAAFLLVGLLGFVPGITGGYSDLSFAGRQSEAHLLGLFQISVLHNVVHLLFGVIGIAASRSFAGARGFLVGAGATTWCSPSTASSSGRTARPTSCRSTPPTTCCTSAWGRACSPPA